MPSPTRNPRWIDWSILIGAGFFIFALVLSAVFDPTIRVLHVLQALIYIAVIVLTRRQNAWGFGAGCLIAAFWTYINLFVVGGIAAVAYLVAIIHISGPQYIPLVKRVSGLA